MLISYLKILLQYFLPKHWLSLWAGKIAMCQHPGIKNWVIQRFIKQYDVDMSQAQHSDVNAYSSFHHFFIRNLKAELRPICNGPLDICAPADGCVTQWGQINDGHLIQAKGMDYSLETLLGGDKYWLQRFEQGNFCTIYLAPRDYHRVHIPATAELRSMIAVPGNLFSVNTLTANHVPQLFTRNERVINCFETPHGAMAVIMVGACIVGRIYTTWAGLVTVRKMPQIQTIHYPPQATAPLHYKRGDEIGYFSLGSTVIILFERDSIQWTLTQQSEQVVKMGEKIGEFIKK